MASVTINFTSGKSLHLDMIKYQAEDLLMALAEHPDGATIISDENKKPLHVIRRGQVTFVTIEP